jgi:tubulin monoglycylase TTLL3/8
VVEQMVDTFFEDRESDDDDGCTHVAPNISDSEWRHLDEHSVSVFEPGRPKDVVLTGKSGDDYDMKKKDEEKKSRKERNRARNMEKKWEDEDYELSSLNDEDVLKILVLLDRHRCIPFSQAPLSGTVSKNVWIVKPAGKSRGRGIECLNNLDEIINTTRTQDGRCAESQWVIQKYIENPMIIHRRKFDIRQWVLVTSFNPLRIYFFSKCYLRFCAVDYSLDNLEDKFMHLANNSIAKESAEFKTSHIKGNMWHSTEFVEYLKETTGTEDTWYKNIQPRLKKIVAWSLMCVQDMVTNRPRSCELYGYDFMIDDQYNPQLIEVNSSPAMDYSTGVTKSLVKEVLPDCIKVLLDREKWQKEKLIHRPGKKARAKKNTGNWELIYDAPRSVTRSNTSLAADLVVTGNAMAHSKLKKKKRTTSITLAGDKKEKEPQQMKQQMQQQSTQQSTFQRENGDDFAQNLTPKQNMTPKKLVSRKSSQQTVPLVARPMQKAIPLKQAVPLKAVTLTPDF